MAKRVFAIGLGLFLSITTGCDSGSSPRIDRLEKQVDELKVEVKKNQTAADFDSQAKCSRDAKAWFNDNWSRDKDTILLDFTNHYNKAQNKCFILVEYHYSYDKNGSWMNQMSLWDVYENSKYGHVTENHIIMYQPKLDTRDSVLGCEIQDQKCKAVAEFDTLLQPYMNN